MQLTFNSIEEVKEFVKSLKGTRSGKGGDGDGDTGQAGTTATAPAPLQPPTAGFTAAPGPFGGAPATGFAAATAVDAAVLALGQRIVAKLDAALASGQPADAALAWFRGQCGPEAAAATMDQIKSVFLPRLTVPALENIAKLMGA